MKIKSTFFLGLFFTLIGTQSIWALPPDTIAYTIQFLKFNSKYTDYAPTKLEDQLLFCSDRPNAYTIVYENEGNEQFLSKLYSVNKNKIKMLPAPINDKTAIGSASYSELLKTLFFTKSVSTGGNTRLCIFISQKEGSKWKVPQSFTHNKEKSNVAHPAIAPNGNYILFSSDMPGGFGGYDLYISFSKDSKWSRPINLGSSVNTEMDEITPFIHPNGLVYFSSNGHNGAGGYDIYSVEYKNFEWKNIKNIGYPFNTSFDDHSFSIEKDLNSGYFSSNRLRGYTDDDVYSFSKTTSNFENCDTLKPFSLCRTFFENSSIQTDSLPLTYEWDLGDGNKLKGMEVKHCYAAPGKYLVQLNVVDLITNQLFMNEATYELEIKPIQGAYIESPDTLILGKEYVFSGSKSSINGSKPFEYVWDFGDGQYFKGENYAYSFSAVGTYNVRLGTSVHDSDFSIRKNCVIKKVNVLTQEQFNHQKGTKKAIAPMSDIAKTLYQVKDKEGNLYKIQLATSEKSIMKEFKKFEGLTVDEYQDRSVFGYTTGQFKSAEEAYPTLKRVRRQGFKEAVVIAMNHGKVVSGTDSSFYIDLPEGFVPIKLVTIKGRVSNKKGQLVPAQIVWESLTTGEKMGEATYDTLSRDFNISLLDGDLYGYYASYPGYYPASNHIDLREENDLSEMTADIVLTSFNELTYESGFYKINNIFFEPDQYEIQSESYPELKRLAGFIKQRPNLKVEIAGHTDHVGDDFYNQTLSQKRANSVMQFLVKNGCARENLYPKGYGKSKPVTANKKLRELNRRVEFRILK